MIRRPPRSTLFPTRRSSDLGELLLERDEGRTGIVARPPISLNNVGARRDLGDRKSTRLNSSHVKISYAVFCLKKKKKIENSTSLHQQKLDDKSIVVHLKKK